ncbi:hypothetical protein [Embleya sp. NPDC050493]|uniref:hypothetical protein n=1 Tax=Embleya sp. NPDC050493 TaxID=3363989 RepID=UPI003796B5EC
MNEYETSAVSRIALYAAYRLAPEETAAKLPERLKTETLRALDATYEPPPRALSEAVLASGDRDLLARYAANDHLDEDVARELARRGDPVVGYALLTTRGRDDRTRAAVWASADPADPAWRTEVADRFIDGQMPEDLLRSALWAPFPEVVRNAVCRLAPYLPPWLVVDCALRILTALDPAAGRDELVSLAGDLPESDDGPGHYGPSTALRAAAEAADPVSALRDLRTDLGGRPQPRPDHDAWLVGLRFGAKNGAPGDVDWDTVRAEEARDPYSARAKIELARHPGCPPEIMAAAVRDGIHTSGACRLGPVPLSAALPPETPGDLAALLVHGIGAGWYAIDHVLDIAAPAGEVLHALHRLSPRRAGTDTDAVDAGSGPYRGPLPPALAPAVSRLVAPLGDDPEAWVCLYKLVARFRGTCRELVAAAVEQASAQRATGSPATWTKPLEAKFPAEAPEGGRTRLYVLLAAAPEPVQRAVIPALDPRAIQHLTVYYPLSAAVRAHLYTVGGTPVALANAAHWEMPADVVHGLLDLDDPEVNAHLYDFGAIAQEERVRICAGRPRDGSDRVVAISPALVDLLARTSPATRRNWLLAALDSGDPALVRAMLGRTRLHTDAGRIRAAIGLWRRHGPDAVAALLIETEFPGRRPAAKHPFPPATHTLLRRAQASPETGQALLRDALAAARTPDAVTRYLLRGGAAERLEHVEAEYGIDLPWDHLVAVDRETPLPPRLLEALVERADCPRPLLAAFLSRTPLPSRMLDVEWVNAALDDGRLHTEDLIRVGTPASSVVPFLTRPIAAGTPAADAGPSARTQVLAIMADLGFDRADPEHWAVALHLLPEFTATVPELLSVTVSITG